MLSIRTKVGRAGSLDANAASKTFTVSCKRRHNDSVTGHPILSDPEGSNVEIDDSIDPDDNSFGNPEESIYPKLKLSG
jgi:hypothetical protein